MKEVIELKMADKAVEEFKRRYAARYGSEPILGSSELQLFLRDLIRQFGEAKTVELIRHFISNNGHMNWWKGKGHSVKVFKQDIEAINASLSLTNRSRVPTNNGYDPLIDFETQCPNCEGWHHIVCKASESEKHAYTTHCRECNEKQGVI